jgi:hypothetical protein
MRQTQVKCEAFSFTCASHDFLHRAGSLDKKARRRCRLLLCNRWHLLPPFLSNEPDTDLQCVLYKGLFPPFIYVFFWSGRNTAFLIENYLWYPIIILPPSGPTCEPSLTAYREHFRQLGERFVVITRQLGAAGDHYKSLSYDEEFRHRIRTRRNS